MGLDRLLRSGRRVGSRFKRSVFPSPEVAAWRKACHVAERVPRHTRGTIRLLDYDLEYVDLLTLCPQWDDIFVQENLKVRLSGDAPRILDCGANVGLASLYFKKLHSRARITAYEADPAVHDVLQRNMHTNGLDDVEAVQAAVWVENGTISFRCEGADSGSVDALAGDLPGDTRTVPAVRLKEVLAQEPVDLLKLDIEGAEGSVLEDCLPELNQVGALLLDVHEFDPSKRQTGRITAMLSEAGFVYSLDSLIPLPWRKPVAEDDSPFAGTHLCWASLIRAWRA